MAYLTLTKDNIKNEHICCAFSDKKCAESYELKKQWLTAEFDNGYVFRRLDERAKVFIEYGPTEKAWIPVTVPNYMMIGCFWVSGKFKGHGHGKALLTEVIEDAKNQSKSGLVTVVGTKKYHFMSDKKWLMSQGFELVESIPSGFSLISLDLQSSVNRPFFNESVRSGTCPKQKGIVVYYSNRCPYSEYHVKESLVETAKNRDLPLKAIKLETMEQAQMCPSPATIFSLFLNGAFITTDISVCMENRFDRIVGKR
jgi:GNAT superfamily N-acetyltransferase